MEQTYFIKIDNEIDLKGYVFIDPADGEVTMITKPVPPMQTFGTYDEAIKFVSDYKVDCMDGFKYHIQTVNDLVAEGVANIVGIDPTYSICNQAGWMLTCNHKDNKYYFSEDDEHYCVWTDRAEAENRLTYFSAKFKNMKLEIREEAEVES